MGENCQCIPWLHFIQIIFFSFFKPGKCTKPMASALDIRLKIFSTKLAKRAKEELKLLLVQVSWCHSCTHVLGSSGSPPWAGKTSSSSCPSPGKTASSPSRPQPLGSPRAPNLNLFLWPRSPIPSRPVIAGEGWTAAHRPPFNHP